jgi:hypothetical protein
LVRVRAKRNTKPTNRYGYADIICYALNVAKEIEGQEPRTYKEAMASIEAHNLMRAIHEEMESL